MVEPSPGPGIRRWGDTQHALPAKTRALIEALIGPGHIAWSAESAEPSKSRLTSAMELVDVGCEVSTSADDRRYAARGMAFIDMVEAREVTIPDAVVTPSNGAAVQAVIDWCRARDIAIVPRGGGTSVVGGLSGPHRPWISLDTSALTTIDEPLDSMVRVGAGVTGPQLEAFLGERGWVFGHLPQSWERASIGGYAATRSAGQNSSGYGRIEDLIVQADLATPIGHWQVGSVPASAVGPDLLRIVLGSEGTLGVFTEFLVRIRPRPPVRKAEAALAPNWSAGLAAVEALALHDTAPAVLRLSDVAETDVTFRTSPDVLRHYASIRGVRDGCLIIMDWHGSAAEVAAARHDAWEQLRRHRVIHLGKRVGEAWRKQRFHGPYLRDQLIAAGYFVETVETAAPWHRLESVHDEVTQLIRGFEPNVYVMAHVSHVYPMGASLYFTVVASGDFVRTWPQAKHAVTQTLRRLGVTSSHHHGVGIDHAPWLGDELGPVGITVVRAIKATVDPTNIMNPALGDAAR